MKTFKKSQKLKLKRPRVKRYGGVAEMTTMPTADGVTPASPGCFPYKSF